MKILEALTDTNIGGAGILLATRCAYLDRSKYEVTIVLPKGSQLKERFERLAIDVIEIDACYDRSFEGRSIPKWIAVLKRIRPELVNCHGCLSCRIAARLCHVPVLVDTRHCAFPPRKWQTRFPGKYFLGWGMRMLSDQTIAVADAAKQNLLEMGGDPHRIRVIINGAEAIFPMGEEEKRKTRERLGIPNHAIVVGMFARLEAYKGHACFLRAASLLIKKNPNFRFLIVGDGSMADALKKEAGRMGIKEYTLFTGFACDVAPLWNITQIQVNCSVGTETSSLALSEGMSLGIPAVASNFGGNPYMIRDGENGFLFPMDQHEILAERIESIAGDPLLYLRLSKGARRRFEQELNAQRMTEETEALYDALLLSKGYRSRG